MKKVKTGTCNEKSHLKRTVTILLKNVVDKLEANDEK